MTKLYYIKYRDSLAKPTAWLFLDKKRKAVYDNLEDAMLKIQELILTTDKQYVIVDENEIAKSMFYTSKFNENIND